MAFPTTSIFDDFNRTDEDPLVGSGGVVWAGPVWDQASGEMLIVTNEAVSPAGSGSSYWTTNAGPDCEAWGEVGSSNSHIDILARCVQEGGATLDSYRLRWTAGDDEIFLYRGDNDSYTQLDSYFINSTAQTGDMLGLECIGSAIKGYVNDGGAGWTERHSATDATYTAEGKIAFATRNASTAWEEVGGGTIAVAGGGPKGPLGQPVTGPLGGPA